jgi:thiamine biosynthesis lipoprotein
MNMRLKRRGFLRIVGVGSVAGLAAYASNRDNQRARFPDDLRVSETRLLMGTVVNLTLITHDQQFGREAIRACLNHMASLERVLSRHRQDSQLSQLNRDGHLEHASVNLVRVLREAVRISALTEGAFDVTVKPLVDLYQTSFETTHSLPSPARVAATLEKIGSQHLAIQGSGVFFTRSEMAITLDGIAKGYIVDEGVLVLQRHGFQNTLVEAGGDLSASGVKEHHHPWRIGIQSPRQNSDQLLHSFSITNQAAATSGDYIQAYTDDFTAHHIVDPRTGVSAPELASVTVIASSAMQADALATAVMVMGPERGLALINNIPLCEAYLVAKDSSVRPSSGFIEL